MVDFCTVFSSPLVTDPGDGEVLDGHVGLVHEHHGVHEDGEHGEREIVERRKSTKDIESFVCGIQVEDALKAVMENAHRNEDTGSESNDLHKVCSEDEDPCEGVNGIYESEQRGEISPSQEEDFVFSEVNEDVQDITQDQGLHANEEMHEESLTGKIESIEPSMEAEINDSRRFDGKLSRQQELRQSENEVG